VKHIQGFSGGNLKVRDHWEDLCIEGLHGAEAFLRS
jgi:hypothetical protein